MTVRRRISTSVTTSALRPARCCGGTTSPQAGCIRTSSSASRVDTLDTGPGHSAHHGRDQEAGLEWGRGRGHRHRRGWRNRGRHRVSAPISRPFVSSEMMQDPTMSSTYLTLVPYIKTSRRAGRPSPHSTRSRCSARSVSSQTSCSVARTETSRRARARRLPLLQR